MKKIIIVVLFMLVPLVNAKIKDKCNEVLITNNDNYNYSEFIINSGDTLVIPKEIGILSNDSCNEVNITILEDSRNSSLYDLSYNNDGSLVFTPSNSVYGLVTFKYYIYNDSVSNISYISFYVNDGKVPYYINYYEDDTLIVPSTINYANIGDNIEVDALYIDGYYLNSDKSIKKEINTNTSFDFYYVSYINSPKTGLFY